MSVEDISSSSIESAEDVSLAERPERRDQRYIQLGEREYSAGDRLRNISGNDSARATSLRQKAAHYLNRIRRSDAGLSSEWFLRGFIDLHYLTDSFHRALNRLGVDRPYRQSWSWMSDGRSLAVGGFIPDSALAVSRLRDAGIDIVLNASDTTDPEDLLRVNGIIPIQVYIDDQHHKPRDNFPIPVEVLGFYGRLLNDLQARGHKVLIHCTHGVGRSVLVTMASLIMQGKSADEAMAYIRQHRPYASLLPEQQRNIADFEQRFRSGTLNLDSQPWLQDQQRQIETMLQQSPQAISISQNRE